MSAGESAAERAQRQREKAERLLRSADLWERGATGESVTAAALSGLGDDWHVLHDVAWPGRRFANIDHVVIGPPGVYVVDSKNWSGEITWPGGVLRQNGRWREPAVLGVDAAVEAVRALTKVSTPIFPVLCFVRDEAIDGRARNVLLCSTSTVARLIGSGQQRLTPEQVQAVVQDLSVLRPAGASGARLPEPRSGRASARRPVRAPRPPKRLTKAEARRRARFRADVVKLVCFLGLAVLMLYVPGFREWLVPAFIGLFTETAPK